MTRVTTRAPLGVASAELTSGTALSNDITAFAHPGKRHTTRKFHMSTHIAQTSRRDAIVERRLSTETKAAFKTTEFVAYLITVVGVLVAAAIVDATDFGSQDAWFFVTLLTIGYMVSRGLAKSGSRDFYDAERDDYDGAGDR